MLAQFANEYVPMLCTLAGTLIPVSLAQPENVKSLISVIWFGRVTLVRPVQPWKAPLPSPRMLAGRLAPASLAHPENAMSPMTVTPLPNVTLVMFEQSANARLPMLPMLSAILMLVMLVQPSKARASMLMTFMWTVVPAMVAGSDDGTTTAPPGPSYPVIQQTGLTSLAQVKWNEL